MIDATTTVTARYGYREASITRIVAQAKVSRATFYENFDDKESCFLAAHREIVDRIQAAVGSLDREAGVSVFAGFSGGCCAMRMPNRRRHAPS